MENKMITDQELTRIFENDSKNLNIDSTIGERLQYTFMLKSSSYKTTQNSFAEMVAWFFSWSHVPVKMAFVSIILFLSLVNFPPTDIQFISPGQDTTLNTIPLKVDSAGMLPFYADTCVLSKSFSNDKDADRSNLYNSDRNWIQAKTIFLKSNFPLSMYKTFSIYRPVPFSSRKFQTLHKLRITGSNNIALFESPLVA